ncbi:HlyD family secretion protein [Pseudomonas syringae]|uniref:HlyD family secretion protein n=1 Tax=Pseudomonas syringae TaxID=317 RepID=UPI0009B0D63A|nr:HlyD family secretion protein [Pseudomonas syringae]
MSTTSAPSKTAFISPWLKSISLVLVSLAVVIGCGIWGARYWSVGRFVESTDNAYVKADSSIVAPKVSGYIRSLAVGDNQPVKAGELLATLDDRDYRNALNATRSATQASRATVAAIDARVHEQEAVIDQSVAGISAARANRDMAMTNRSRSLTLSGTGLGSRQEAEEATARQRVASAQLDRELAKARTSERKVETLKAQKVVAQARLQQALAMEKQAELNLEHTQILSPVDGTVGSRTARVGQFVQPGTDLMAVVPLNEIYVIANFKETQISRIKGGEAVTIKVDTFSEEEIQGHVQSLSPASGLEFSLLPSDNATGNFTKIVQRIPVKIVLDMPPGLLGRLRPGMSVQANIRTHSSS